METKKIKTEIGIIDGRDSIEINELNTSLKPINLFLKININTSLCSENRYEKGFINGTITFSDVKKYEIFSLDFYPLEKYLSSSFDEVMNSPYLLKYNLIGSHKHLILSAYDHILEVICKEYQLNLPPLI